MCGLSPCEFPTWRKVRVGIYGTREGYLAAIGRKEKLGYDWPFKCDFLAGQILEGVVWEQEEREEELVRVLDRDLGLVCEYTIGDLFAAAASFGLIRCVAEVGPATREQYVDQPVMEMVAVAMDPIMDYSENPEVFTIIQYSDAAMLRVLYAESRFTFFTGNTWIFSRRKPASAT